MIVFAMLRVLPPLLYMPPPSEMPLAELPERVEFVSVTIPLELWLKMPPPMVVALLAENVELLMVEVLFELLKTPAPKFALLPERVELETVRAPLLKIPPPKSPTVLPEMVELETLRVPTLLNAPPLPVVIWAPETVTPEIERLPPEAILKMLKSRLILPPSKPLIIKEEEPGPVMVTVPAVPPPVIGVVVSIMVGNDFSTLSKVMVPVMLKSMVSLPAVVLARSMASRRVPPVAVSAKEVT
jgi:hypothetical protein